MLNVIQIMLAAEETEERTNITPILLRFGGKFLAIFAIVAVVTILTPRMAKRVDQFREKHSKPDAPEDPRCKAVKGPYDMPEPLKKKQSPAEQRQHAEQPHRRKHPRPADAPKPYRPKHVKRSKPKNDR